MSLREEDAVVRLPKRTIRRLRRLRVVPNEPYYSVIDRHLKLRKEVEK